MTNAMRDMTPDQTAAVAKLVTYLCDALTTVGEVDPNAAADMLNAVRVFDPTESGMAAQLRDTIRDLPQSDPEDDGLGVSIQVSVIPEDEDMIRELVAYGDTLVPNASAIDLLLGLADATLAPADVEARTREIIGRYYSTISDSLIEDLIEALSDTEDDGNE